MKQGWEVKKLGDVASISSGNSAPQKKELFEKGTYPFIRTSDVGQIRKGSINACVNYLNKEGIKGLKLFKRGTILFPKSGASTFLNHRVIIAIDGYVSSHLATIKAKNERAIDSYLLYYLITIDARDLMQDIAYPSLKTSDIGLIEIPLPPLPEQQRIVTVLDEAFAAIAKAKANAEQNLKNAKELFESYLQSVFENKGEGWEYVKLSTLATDITDGDHMPPPKTEAGIPFITISNINKQNHQIDFSDTFSVSTEYFQKLKGNRKPKKGDVLYTVTGSYGIPVLIGNDFEFCFQRHIGLIRPKENVSSKWLYYWILSPQAFMQANDTATGTAQKTVSLTALRNFIVPKMSLSEQQTIVQKLDALSAQTKKLEAIYQQHLNNLDELKKSGFVANIYKS